MKNLNQKAARVLNQLVAGLDGIGDARKIDNARGTFMAVSVDRVGFDTFSVAHYFTQNGDAMADPDVVFYRGRDGGWYPTEVTMSATGYYRRCVEFEGGLPVRYNRAAQRDLAMFCNEWMLNIKDQQGDLEPKPREPIVLSGGVEPWGRLTQTDDECC